MAKKKIYAVRKGNKTGLFYSWDECKKAVHGYSGAEYKGFLTKDEAEAFLNIGKITKGNMIITEMDVSEKMNETISDKIRSTTDKLIVYVDGSFDIHLQKYSFGCVILLEDGRILERYGNGEEPELLAIRNVAGEMYGAMYAVQWAFENGYSSVVLHYDYEGIEKWANHTWMARRQGTQAYQTFIDESRQKIEIHFMKVLAHSGDLYNEMADLLAKKAVGIA